MQDNTEVATLILESDCLGLNPGVLSDLCDFAELLTSEFIGKIGGAAPVSQGRSKVMVSIP